MFSANQTPRDQRKDTVVNAEATQRFCWSLATWELREYVNRSAEWLDHGVDEFEHVGLEKAYSTVLGEPKVPMVKASPVNFECVYYTTLRLPGNPPMGTADVVIGRVVGVHIADWALTDGVLDARKTNPIARCGYYQYTVVRELFDMIIPGDSFKGEELRSGMEGSVKLHREMANGSQSREAVAGSKDPDKEAREESQWDSRLVGYFTREKPQQ